MSAQPIEWMELCCAAKVETARRNDDARRRCAALRLALVRRSALEAAAGGTESG
jgi:hypothetical protein